MVSESTRITLTIGQLRRLVKEADLVAGMAKDAALDAVDAAVFGGAPVAKATEKGVEAYLKNDGSVADEPEPEPEIEHNDLLSVNPNEQFQGMYKGTTPVGRIGGEIWKGWANTQLAAQGFGVSERSAALDAIYQYGEDNNLSFCQVNDLVNQLGRKGIQALAKADYADDKLLEIMNHIDVSKLGTHLSAGFVSKAAADTTRQALSKSASKTAAAVTKQAASPAKDGSRFIQNVGTQSVKQAKSRSGVFMGNTDVSDDF